MDRLRASIRSLTPAQRGTLALLTALVLVVAGVLIVSLARPDDPESTAAPATSTSVTTPTTTTTTDPGASTSTSTTEPTTTTSTTEPTTTTTEPPERALVLRPDGLGDLYFGDPAGDVLGGLEVVLGAPDEDTGWVDQLENYGTCLGSEVRFVRWRSLNVFFTDGPSDWGPADFRHVAAYTHSGFLDPDVLDLVSSDGLSLGSPVGDVRALYGQGAVTDDEVFGPLWVFDPPGSGYQWGEVSGTEPEDTVESISGGFACGE